MNVPNVLLRQLRDAFYGEPAEECDHCDGTGEIWESCGCYECEYDGHHSRYVKCLNCDGSGKVRGVSNLWLKTKDQELAERVKDQMPRNSDLRWYVAKSGDPEFPWGLFNELVRYGDGAMAEQEAA